MHAPAVQFLPAAHLLPQLPQLLVSVCLLVSQPSPTCPLQSANPTVQFAPHVLLLHTAVPLAGTAHTLPH